MQTFVGKPEVTNTKLDSSGVFRVLLSDNREVKKAKDSMSSPHSHVIFTFTAPEQLRNLAEDLELAAKMMESNSDTSATEGNP